MEDGHGIPSFGRHAFCQNIDSSYGSLLTKKFLIKDRQPYVENTICALCKMLLNILIIYSSIAHSLRSSGIESEAGWEFINAWRVLPVYHWLAVLHYGVMDFGLILLHTFCGHHIPIWNQLKQGHT
ncbi:hypothetical protein F511_29813 [Dorcoceras hygrometricum]|uniref:Uncharacterized protein n=1 Tax=Dorcoceras hygrometricum TaxID=472368 RepID=A0A2Z7C5D5_9LAMI|nr:hypothetical protein F511_29813 [Dorcoceras hygrometricum]